MMPVRQVWCKVDDGAAIQVPLDPGGALDVSFARKDPKYVLLCGKPSLVGTDGVTKYSTDDTLALFGRNVGITAADTVIIISPDAVAGRAAVSGVVSDDLTAAFLRQLGSPQHVPLSALDAHLKEPLPLRLPVTDALYAKLAADSALQDLLQPVSACGADKLSVLVSGVLNLVLTTPEDEIVVAGYVDRHVYDVMLLMASELHGHSLKRKRNCMETSLTAAGLKPDFILLVLDRLLLKGEDKTLAGDMDIALQELAMTLKDWSVVYHHKIEYLLCYAAAGTCIQFCALERGKAVVHLLGPQLDLQDSYHRIHAVVISIKLFFIVMSQADKLPRNVLLASTVTSANGTSIFKGDTFVEKSVQLSLQPELAGKQQLMSEVYDAVKGCDKLVQLHKGSVTVRGDCYRVFLEPRA